LWYVFKKAREAGGIFKLYSRLRSRNACKTCAVGMGGQRGGMVNEAGHFPEVCKKSVQAQVGDMQAPLTEEALARLPLEQRESILLVGLEGMRYDEAAVVLGVPIGTVRSRLSRGREALRKLMQLDEFDAPPARWHGRPCC